MSRRLRVVSLVPSVTETLLAWGVDPLAVTRFCERPQLTQVGGTKDPDVAAIVALNPDLVVMCREENRAADAEALTQAGVEVHEISPATVADVKPALDALAGALGFSGLPVPFSLPPTAALEPLALRAFVPIWRRPWMTMTGDTYGSSVLAALGVLNVFDANPADHARSDDGGGAGGGVTRLDAERYPVVTLEEVGARHPDVVLAPSEPYPFSARHVAELEQVAPVVLLDGQDLFWWGARTPEALTRLYTALSDLPGRTS